ncbi:hypothetical protein Atc_2466 [Acidithiobacillus caldus SM-1]|uniref:Uncharacterized protein n=1 Tax=Acidithiobacillus caldus (strain SM-1) TaxID=990288 RepID=F9ZRV0_ACICS|nr:hypothetical protein Atc_2466 [Acidithiobacillus caldus SM-1]
MPFQKQKVGTWPTFLPNHTDIVVKKQPQAGTPRWREGSGFLG